jgi:nucleoside-diphosphate-sugar epimerase
MSQTKQDQYIIGPNDLVLVTGATGFIGSSLVDILLALGLRNLRCFARPSSDTTRTKAIGDRYQNAKVEVFTGNLLSLEACVAATDNVAVIFHLAAGTGQSYFADAFMNSVVTTRNLLEACNQHKCLKRFVSVSSFAVYRNMRNPRRGVLDESCAVEEHPELRGEAYCYAKVKQEQLAGEYCQKFGFSHVIVRPGYVYGPGKEIHTGRVGIDTFGIFLHLGGANKMPFTFVDNCAQAIALAGLKEGIDGEAFNVVDDDLPSSREFLRLHKRHVKRFASLYVPHFLSYLFCYLWERYSIWSQEQLPPAFNRLRWHAYWKRTKYTNEKLKTRLGWVPKVPTAEGLRLYFESFRGRGQNA